MSSTMLPKEDKEDDPPQLQEEHLPTSSERPPLEELVITVTYPGFAASRSQMAKYTGADGVTVLHNAFDTALSRQRRRRRREGDKTKNKHDRSAPLSSNVVDVKRLPRCTQQLLEQLKSLPSREPQLVRDNDDDDDDDDDDGVLYHAKCRRAAKLLYNVLPSPEVHELVTLQSRSTWNPLKWATIVKSWLVAWYFDLEGVPSSYMKLSRVNLGGFVDQKACEGEIRRAVDVVKRLESSTGHRRKLVLFGCSRGATTTLLTALKLPEQLAEYVALVVVEAPFDTLHNVVHESSWFPRATLGLIRSIGIYDGDAAYAIPGTTHLTCPIAFVMSKADVRVPNTCTQRVMDAVRKKLPQVPLETLVLQRSGHSSMAVGCQKDRDAYEAFLHKLYAKYILLEEEDKQ